jgi:hypothetical protein
MKWMSAAVYGFRRLSARAFAIIAAELGGTGGTMMGSVSGAGDAEGEAEPPHALTPAASRLNARR